MREIRQACSCSFLFKTNRMPLKICLFAFAALIATSFTQAQSTFGEALRNGWISMDARLAAGFGEHALRLTLTNHHKKMELLIPAGWHFVAEDTSVQNALTTQEVLVSLEKDQKRTLRLHAFCTNASKLSPRLDQAYISKGPAEGKMKELAQYVHRSKTEPSAVQGAVWSLSDGLDLTGIVNPELATFTAHLTGQPVPEYFVRNGYQPEPGGPAYSYEPVSVEGLFEHRTEKEEYVNFGLYNAAGEPVQMFFENKSWWVGQHRFQFTFRVWGFPGGEHEVRLSDNSGKVLGSKRVSW